MWIGDFVRCHSVVQVLRQRWPSRPVDVLTNTLTLPLIDYMPGVRKGIVSDLPRKRLPMRKHRELARRLKAEAYGTALIMPRTWKAALAPCLAGVPERVGFFGEVRLGLLNDIRWGERALPRMIDQCASLALPRGSSLPDKWPAPRLEVPLLDIEGWRTRRQLRDGSPVVAFAPGAVGSSKRWPLEHYAELARKLGESGYAVWILGGPAEAELAREIAQLSGRTATDLTGPDLRDAVLGLAAADLAVSNDSGLLHVAAAIGTPTIGIFGPTSSWHWAPLNPLAGTVQLPVPLPCQPCHKPACRLVHHKCMRDLPAEDVLALVRRVMPMPSAPLVAAF
ncbi:MAG: heptosyltransferase [Variibacter sp.]|jgi:heptosyltransferase-2|nr:heptosyltransferase [Variibacter sp.]